MMLMQILRPSRPTYMMTWQVEFVERALREDLIHWMRIFWTATRQYLGLIPRGSACYLSPFLINFYRGMGVLNVAEIRDFALRKNSGEGPRGRQDSQSRKRQRIDEAAVAKERLRRVTPVEMRLLDFRAKSKMKSRRLILKEYSSMESRGVAARERSTQEARLVAITDTEEEVPAGKKPRTMEEKSALLSHAGLQRKTSERRF
ncbi:hypothetical protein AXG93_2987s1020 [Marchantia polymorpha subsp. ruderalis]|uniref:Uncharacterized protein n=1 Tax=Marchantia polymorpha subsp. ruderalis TaxID=1480154 RepID=A0A176WSM1_MARPO|nr:hypothetical protein AXG93_2987s1020 [Marchantia polymorpha subsp. ruderalis]